MPDYEDLSDYAIEIDPDVLLQDYDDADEYQHLLEEETDIESDIQFE